LPGYPLLIPVVGLYQFFRFKLEKLVTVERVDFDLTDLGFLENAEGDVDSCLAQAPNLAVKIRKPIHGFSIYGEDKVTRAQSRRM
jgi:hypothetical protein